MAPCNSPSVSRKSSHPWSRGLRAVLVPVLFLLVAVGHAQNRRELEKRRDALDKQIRTTNSLIGKAQQEQKATQHQLQLIQAQIGQRQELINTMTRELQRLDRDIQENQGSIQGLELDLEKLKAEYARMLQFAYTNRSSYDRLSYIFAASSFTQAFRRSRYLDQLAEQRRQQADLIIATRDDLGARANELQEQRSAKVRLMEAQMGERRKLAKDQASSKTTLTSLQQQEGRLKETLRKQEQQRAEVAAAIRKAIEEELRKKTPKASPGTKTNAGLAMTPEAKELSAEFEKNKGKLPWPVEKGVITGRFGPQPHPVLRDVQIDLAGVDISTEPGSRVRAIFRGEVSSVIVIPGGGKAVMVNHGGYWTVYTNLLEVSVSKGQKVDTKQVVGTVITENGESVAHIEIWKIAADGSLSKVDPAQWMSR